MDPTRRGGIVVPRLRRERRNSLPRRVRSTFFLNLASLLDLVGDLSVFLHPVDVSVEQEKCAEQNRHQQDDRQKTHHAGDRCDHSRDDHKPDHAALILEYAAGAALNRIDAFKFLSAIN